MLPLLTNYGDLAALALRFAISAIFIAHGWPKIKDLKTTASNFEMMGFKPGNFWGTVVAVVEFIGGLCILFGFLTQIAAVLLAIDMLVASIWKIRSGQKLIGGYELDIILLTAALVLATLGPGIYSLDNYFPIVLF